ncbi:hypothetical protein QBC47DRAFT_384736 [Echria macrotheca]|uniref:Protection of telomeres protein 1 n=1 Tax=Echria macrotheca TaxID=438768 RepID=A0AAJ0F5N1_9PEZI|nr:hypothetical protein QBC47DRAFT_384736 [Echria macrotheca]
MAHDLPPTFIPIGAIVREEVRAGTLVNTIGIVTDCRLPFATGGEDWKSTLTLRELGDSESNEQVDFVIFRPEATMPRVGSQDVVVLYKARVQQYRSGPFSLITHKATSIAVYTASKIPRPPNSAAPALVPLTAQDKAVPKEEVHRYVSHAFHKTDRGDLPTEEEFAQKTIISLNVKPNKFKLLRDVKEDQFCDLIVQVARKPFDLIDKITLYVSDYSENNKFYHYTMENISDLVSAASLDPYNYRQPSTQASVPEETKDAWVGPYGKKVIQITCYDSHAEFVRTQVNAGHWLMLKNVHIKYGKNGQYLEGFLRGSQNFAEKNQVAILDIHSGGKVDERLKEAIRRWRDEDKKLQAQVKAIEEAKAAGSKRKADTVVDETNNSAPGPKKRRGRTNAQQKRKEERAQKFGLEEQRPRKEATEPEPGEHPSREHEEEKLEQECRMNPRITCESHPSASTVTIATMLEPVFHEETGEGGDTKRFVLPFVCAKYRTRVRVVDFAPNTLEDFAQPRKASKYGSVLTDDSGSDSDAGPVHIAIGHGRQEVQWEWRFALQLEDTERPSRSRPADRMWVVVDNAEAQCLTDMDATNLREDETALEQLRERMFLLWGNLEELKREAAADKKKGTKTKAKKGAGGVLKIDKPPLDSSDGESDDQDDGREIKGLQNTPFACFIRQYGVRSQGAAARPTSAGSGSEDDNADEWTRVFGLFGTRIAS